MNIILDTNIFCTDYYLRGSNFHTFLTGLNSLPGKLTIPEIIIDEVVNRYQEDLQKLSEEALKNRLAITRLMANQEAIKPLNLDVMEQTKVYQTDLEGIIRQHGKILPYPQTPHKKIVARDLAREKPFKSNGSGYRDSLIWETIKDKMICGTERMIFITNNSKDFGQGPLIVPELQPELLNPYNLTIFQSLRAFNEALIIPRLRMLEDINTKIFGEQSCSLNLIEWLRTHLIDILYPHDSLGQLMVGLPEEAGRVHPSKIIMIQNLEVAQTRQLDSGEKLVCMRIDVTMEFSITLYWEDYVKHEEVREYLGEGSEQFSSTYLSQIENITLFLDLVLSTQVPYMVNSYEIVCITGGYGSVEFK